MILAKTRNISVFSIVYLLCSMGILGYVGHALFELDAQLEARRTVIATSAQQQQSYQDLLVVLQQTEEDRKELKNIILTEDDIRNFLIEVEQFAQSQGVVFATTELALHDPTFEKFGTRTFLFSFEGDENAVKNIVAILEDMPYKGFIQNVSLIQKNVEGGSGFSGTITLQLSIRTI